MYRQPRKLSRRRRWPLYFQLESLRERDPINSIPTSVENSDAWPTQKDKMGVLPDVPNSTHHKFCVHYSLLNDIDCIIRSAPLDISFTPPGWCSIAILEILKKTGRININEMRLLQLIHPENQIDNKNVGRKVLANAEIYDEVAEE